MAVLLNCLGYYAAAAAIVIGVENCVTALNENTLPRLGWPIFFAALSIVTFTFGGPTIPEVYLD